MNESEKLAAEFLAERGLNATSFTKAEMRSGRKTPDFQVSRNGTFIFYCEIKETTDADPLEDHFVEVAPGISMAEQCQVNNTSRHDRIANRIESAREQFDSVNPDRAHPNVLIFVNTDERSTADDLWELVCGYLKLEGGQRIVTAAPIAREKAQKNADAVDLFIWLGREPLLKPSYRLLFNGTRHLHTLEQQVGK